VLERYGRKRGSCSSGGVWRTAKRDSTGYRSSPPSTPPAFTGYCSSTVDLLQPPPAPVHPRAPFHLASTARYSTGYYSTSPLPGLLFNHPSMGSCSTTTPRATIHPALHRLLFILPSMGWSCSSCPPWGPVHPAPTGSIDRGPVHPEATPRGPIHPPPPGTVHPTPHQRSLFIQRQHR